jgi:threonine dehydratase
MVPTPADVHEAARRIRGRVVRTPLIQSPWLSSVTGTEVWLKLENQQREGSFKTRGALNALMQAGIDRAVTASAGNHGRSLSFAARELGIGLTVFAPATAPKAKTDHIRQHGATLELCETYDDAERRAIAFAQSESLPYISPYNHRDVIAGAGTAGLEILEDLPDVRTVIVPVGGGGLISGIGLAASNRGARIVGAEAAASPVFTTALSVGRLVTVKVMPTLADGLAGNAEPRSMTFELIRDLTSGVVAVSEEDIATAMRGLLEHDGQRVEGAAAVGVAALLAGKIDLRGGRAVFLISGGNVDPETLLEQEPGAQSEQDNRQ